jgi:hypothetical protein
MILILRIKNYNLLFNSFDFYYIEVNFKQLQVCLMLRIRKHNAMVMHRKFDMFKHLIVEIRFLDVKLYQLWK